MKSRLTVRLLSSRADRHSQEDVGVTHVRAAACDQSTAVYHPSPASPEGGPGSDGSTLGAAGIRLGPAVHAWCAVTRGAVAPGAPTRPRHRTLGVAAIQEPRLASLALLPVVPPIPEARLPRGAVADTDHATDRTR